MNLNNIPKYVINLPHRTDRLENVNKELSKVFDNLNYILIPGIYNEIPFKGCAQAHINAVQHAKNNNYSEILIMEDDLIFRDGAKEYINECFADIPQDYDILLGGVYGYGDRIEYNKNWYKINKFISTHFYILSEKNYDKVLSFDKSAHIDTYLGKMLKLNNYITKKFFVIQNTGFSDNENEFKDYSAKLQRFELL
jgi:glycosyl transferase family 25